uniref:RING-type E3 ubiquitin transferase n=1 Tax=Leersia perrieri TaxID=77586 RepID=A0A0D9XNH5_9ORYZ
MSDHQRHARNYSSVSSQPDVQCLVCTRPFTLDAEVADTFEALAICRECKATVLNDDGRDEITSSSRQTARRGQRSRTSSIDSLEDTFLQEFSQLISLARQGREADIDLSSLVPQHASYNLTPNRSQRWHASDDESDGLNYVDSVFGEIESTISFGDYGGDSDTSLDEHSVTARRISIQLDNDTYMNTDTDIDPMNAGLDQWDSDDQEDVQESGFNEAVNTIPQHQQQSHDIQLSGLSEDESEDAVWNWSVTIRHREIMTNLIEDMERPEMRTALVGNPDDYVDARQFEMLLEQFAEDSNSRKGAPPAATSFIENLPSVIISACHQIEGDVICPICKDLIPTRARAKQLPCTHLYHSSCILPWLSSRNTCPVCRYELPTDDAEYERSKQAITNVRDIQVVGHTHLRESVEEISDESDVEVTHQLAIGAMEETNTSEHDARVAEQPNSARRSRGWFFIAAAPVLCSVVLVQHPMDEDYEDKEEVEEARHKGSQAYLAVWQHQGDEKNPARTQVLAEARQQQLHVHPLPASPSLEGNLWPSVPILNRGAMEILQVSDTDMVKDIGRWTPSELGKPTYLKKSRKALFGGGLFTENGDEWAYQRKIIAPEFFMDKIKDMIQLIEDATVPVLEAWEAMISDAGGCKEIVVDDYLRNLKYLPTKSNQEIRTLDEQVRLLILDVAKEQHHHQDAHNSLLNAIIDAAQDGRSAEETEDFIVGSCKTIYFGGHESTAVTAIWCLMLLATHPEWQERARAEAIEVCQGRTPLDIDALRRLKIVTMVIQETLRLYPPASLMMREALTDVKLGNIDVPRGTIVQVPRLLLHLDKNAWGADADEFRPERFANGVAAACGAAHMYVPFGHGPRTCVGQNLAMAELKVVLVRLLTNFAFSPSPTYRHSPAFRLTIEPGFGLPLMVTRLP